jgi:SNF2 family DNA or RNA helicase
MSDDLDFSFLDQFKDPKDREPKEEVLTPEQEVFVEESLKEVELMQLTPLEMAQYNLDQLKKVQEQKRSILREKKEIEKAKDAAYREAIAKLQDARKEREQSEHDARSVDWDIREAERILMEEAHKAAEAQREKELMAKRAEIVAGYKKYIDELNPEWKSYAFDHQWEGAAKLAMHDGGLLGDEMGLGKTLTSIMFLDMVQAKRVLIITPSATNSNFTIEAGMWAPHRYIVSLANFNKAGRDGFMNTLLKPRAAEHGTDFTVTINKEQLYEDMSFFSELITLNFDTIIIDEAHEFKNTKSLLFQRLLALKMSSSVKRFLPMTGTFVLNSPVDIWPALHLIDQEAFPTERHFTNIYCIDHGHAGRPDWHFKPGGLTALVRTLGGRIVQRTMEECGIVLPTNHMHDISISFDENSYLDQQKVIRMLTKHAQIVLDAEHKTSVMAQIALITRQRQANVWPGGMHFTNTLPDGRVIEFSVGDHIKESIKVDWVEKKARELLAQGKRVTVFSQFKSGLEELENRLSDLKVVRYDGDTNAKTKLAVKRDFDRRHVENNGGEYQWDIVLCNYKVGGVGLNFTASTEMIILDEEWNPGKNQQAYKRISRIGQTEETHIWIPRLEKSIDIWMKQLNDKKLALVEGFNNEVDLQKEYALFLDIIKANFPEESA